MLHPLNMNRSFSLSCQDESFRLKLGQQGRQVLWPSLRWAIRSLMANPTSPLFFEIRSGREVRNVFLHRPGLFGHCLAQVLVQEDGALNLVEINPRLGGASPLALRAGLSSISWNLLQDAMSLEVIPEYPQFRDGLFRRKKRRCFLSYDISLPLVWEIFL